jgi:ATP-independent RNA helicase DbpA
MTQTETSFSSLGLRAPLLTNLASLGYETMTPIQMHSLPMLLKKADVIVQAKTGSGKTVAFGLTLLNVLNPAFFAVQALVMCPTRELAEQVSQALRQLARLMPNIKVLNLSGGMPFRPQEDSLKHGAHIVVGTPGRIQKHLDKNSLVLNKLNILVLDEADRMLDMGFFDDMKKIIHSCPTKRQTLLFSATYPEEIENLANQVMQNPKKIILEENNELNIDQRFYEVRHSADKFSLLKALLLHYKPTSTLIFCNTKEQTVQVTRQLVQAGFSAITLNGDMEQIDRDLAMIRFVNKSCSILVATDVAARGLDIKELPAVINFDLAFDLDVHIHRIGRTGRAGHKGLALNITLAADAQCLCLIEENLKSALIWDNTDHFDKSDTAIFLPEMVTICLNVGRKDKIRPGDILGSLTKEAGLAGTDIEKININTLNSYVAIHKNSVDKACQHFKNAKLKGQKILVRKIV